MMRIKPILINCLIVLMFTPISWAEEKGGGDLRAAVQNPVGAMYSLPLKFTFDYGAPNGEASFLNIQPVIPITVGDWNFINRIIAPLIDTPGQVAGTPEIPNPPPGDGATGLGDINYSLFVSPAKPKGFIWGLGPSIMLPTATDKQLGSEKWSAGPTGVVLVQPKWGTYGGLVRQLWSFAGDDDRASVNQTLIEPFVNYNLDKRLVPDRRYYHHRQLAGRFGSTLDRAPGRRGGQAAENRQPGHQCAHRSLLQCRKAGLGAGLAVGLYGSVSVSQIILLHLVD
jgi:hypothetical protein